MYYKSHDTIIYMHCSDQTLSGGVLVHLVMTDPNLELTVVQQWVKYCIVDIPVQCDHCLGCGSDDNTIIRLRLSVIRACAAISAGLMYQRKNVDGHKIFTCV